DLARPEDRRARVARRPKGRGAPALPGRRNEDRPAGPGPQLGEAGRAAGADERSAEPAARAKPGARIGPDGEVGRDRLRRAGRTAARAANAGASAERNR